jgi:hypothetical protein
MAAFYGGLLRRVGRALESVGRSLQDKEAYVERREFGAPPAQRVARRPRALSLSLSRPRSFSSAQLTDRPSRAPAATVVPSTRVVALRGKEAVLGANTFVASTVRTRGQ